jgi:hypothetical protein
LVKRIITTWFLLGLECNPTIAVLVMRKASSKLQRLVPDFLARPLPSILTELEASPRGLGQEEAARRLKVVGPNMLDGHVRYTALRAFIRAC